LPVDLVYALLVPHRRRRPFLAEAAEDGAGIVPVGEVLVLDQPMRDIDPESVHSVVHPEPQHVDELGSDVRVAPVEVRLGDVEQVQVPLPGLAVRLDHPLPGRAAENAAPGVGRLVAVRAAPVAEQVPVALGAARRGGERRLKPRVRARGVVGYQIHDEPQAQRVRLGDQLVRIGQRAEQRVDRAVVRHVVPRVGLR
jgi:hypothetical protein